VERENQQLRKELEEFKTAAPELILSFADEKTTFVWKLDPVDLEEYVLRHMSTLREENPPMSEDPKSLDLNWMSFVEERNARIRKFNLSLEAALREHEIYIREVGKRLANTVKLVLRIDNGGSIPAQDIEVCLRFPESTQVAEEEYYSKLFPPQPELPRRPALGHLPELFSIETNFPNPPLTIPEFFSQLHVTDQIGDSIRVKVKKLRQKDFIILPKLHLVFNDVPSSFNISYTLRADNMRNIVQGELHVRVDK